MRVRLNFTLDVDVKEYCDKTKQDLNKMQVRMQIQEDCIDHIVKKYRAKGLDVGLLGRNNVYDPIQRLTVAEHLVKS